MNIAAISTPPGIGGIAVIRVSGPNAIEIVDNVFRPFSATGALSSRKSHTLAYGQIAADNGEIIDDVVAAVFRAPHSFTGENVVEISCHGSQYVQQKILETILLVGDPIHTKVGEYYSPLHIRLAEPGEFTRRAFRNGKMDLSQAEAVADLIAANNAASHRLAINQLKGAFSRKLSELRGKLLDLSSLLELELDFSEEDVEFADRTSLLSLAEEIHESVSHLAASFQTGNAIRNGIPVAIIGETNAGKSTLLNHLLGDDKAIVSDIHGTTRDVIEDTCVMNGTLLRFIDTAGIRDTQDTIEALGIERTYQRLSQASIVIWMIDGTRLADAMTTYSKFAKYLNDEQKLITVINKADLVGKDVLEENITSLKKLLSPLLPLHSPSSSLPLPFIAMCAKDDDSYADLKQAIAEATKLPEIQEGDVIVTNIRHYNALIAADNAILRVQEGLTLGISGDFIAQDLRECSHHLGTIIGEVNTEEILGSIFSRFCVGK